MTRSKIAHVGFTIQIRLAHHTRIDLGATQRNRRQEELDELRSYQAKTRDRYRDVPVNS
jgi:hypothetical protein